VCGCGCVCVCGWVVVVAAVSRAVSLTGLPHDEQNLAPGATFGVPQQLCGRKRIANDRSWLVAAAQWGSHVIEERQTVCHKVMSVSESARLCANKSRRSVRREAQSSWHARCSVIK
jgi:hypothetical protein